MQPASDMHFIQLDTKRIASYGADAWTLTKKEEKALIFEGKYLEEYMVLNMKMGKGKVGRIGN